MVDATPDGLSGQNKRSVFETNVSNLDQIRSREKLSRTNQQLESFGIAAWYPICTEVICAPPHTSPYYFVDRWDHTDLAVLVLL